MDNKHLKQVGMDNKQLNGGIILTGGGSQLKHLLQLTEYQTGLNARIGYPNEHLSSGYIDELTKPMYATCIGLILKGYSDFERKKKEFVTSNAEFSIKVPEQFKAPEVTIVADEFPEETPVPPATMEGRKSIWDKLKDSIYDIFKEEDDTELK